MPKISNLNKIGVSDTILTSPSIDWSKGTSFSISISANTTFTFSNLKNGQSISLAVTNTSGSTRTLTFPVGVKSNDLVLDVDSNTTNVYTFLRSNSIIYAAVVSKMA